MERENWREHINSNGNYYDDDGVERSPAKPSSLSSSPPRLAYIDHRVSKFDTLAGVAIKYGVEVLSFFYLFLKSIIYLFISYLCIILYFCISLILIV